MPFFKKFFLFFSFIILAACDEGHANNAQQQADQAKPVDFFKAQKYKVDNSNELPGRVVSYKEADIRPQVTGIIEERLFEEGSYVEKGQQLYQIDPEAFEAVYNMAQAKLKEAEARKLNAQRLFNRFEDLINSKAISAREYDEAVANLEQARASVAMARAEVKSARVDLDFTKVNAPISGYIGPSGVTAGALVTAAQPEPLATIRQLDPIYVDLSQSVSEVQKLQARLASARMASAKARDASLEDEESQIQESIETDEVEAVEQEHVAFNVQLFVDGVEEAYPILGKLNATDLSVAQDTGAIILRTTFENPDMILLPGMFVRAIIKDTDQTANILIPQRTVSITPEGNYEIWLINENGKSEKRMITASSSYKNYWVVEGGLQEGEKVILKGGMGLAPDMAVTGTEFVLDITNNNPPQKVELPPSPSQSKKSEASSGQEGEETE
jgi:membrane fusion protein (multidrug efflux system)